MNINSKLIEEAVDQFATLPGVGRKTVLLLHNLKDLNFGCKIQIR